MVRVACVPQRPIFANVLKPFGLSRINLRSLDKFSLIITCCWKLLCCDHGLHLGGVLHPFWMNLGDVNMLLIIYLVFSNIEPAFLWCHLHFFIFDILPHFQVPLNCCEEHHLREGDHQGENEPELNPLDVRRWWQFFENADQQGCQRQHDRKVDCYCSVEELWQLEEGGDVAQKDKEEGG